MDETNKAEFQIKVSAIDATEEELDNMTRQLLSELRDLDIESVELEIGAPAPEGSKGDPITLGAITMQVLPVAIPSVIGLVQAWVMRGQGRTVKFKGKGIDFEGSPEELKKLLATLDMGKKKKR
jgi:hypothetical protein